LPTVLGNARVGNTGGVSQEGPSAAWSAAHRYLASIISSFSSFYNMRHL